MRLSRRHQQPLWRWKTEIIQCEKKKVHLRDELGLCACDQRGRAARLTPVLAEAGPAPSRRAFPTCPCRLGNVEILHQLEPNSGFRATALVRILWSFLKSDR